MSSLQVDGVCYSETAAVQAMAAREVGRIVTIGAKTYVVDVGALTPSSITYTFSDLTTSTIFTKVVNVTPQPCGLLDTSDGLIIGWLIAVAWLSTAAVLHLRRGVHT